MDLLTHFCALTQVINAFIFLICVKQLELSIRNGTFSKKDSATLYSKSFTYYILYHVVFRTSSRLFLYTIGSYSVCLYCQISGAFHTFEQDLIIRVLDRVDRYALYITSKAFIIATLAQQYGKVGMVHFSLEYFSSATII